MSKIATSIYNIRTFDELSEQETMIHRLHPASKMIVTFTFLATIISFGKYDVSNLLPFLIYPMTIIVLGDLPFQSLLKRLFLVLPFILFISIANIFIERDVATTFMGISISFGLLASLSIIIKTALTVLAGLLLITTCSIYEIGNQLIRFKIPKIFVLQLLLVYRYIAVLIEEALQLVTAYHLRAPDQKGIKMSHMGSFIGHFILRSFDRADRVYQAMKCRGFNGIIHSGKKYAFSKYDAMYIGLWCAFFICARFIDIPAAIEHLFGV